MYDLESPQVILQAMTYQQRLCCEELAYARLYVSQIGCDRGKCLLSDARELRVVIQNGVVW